MFTYWIQDKGAVRVQLNLTFVRMRFLLWDRLLQRLLEGGVRPHGVVSVLACVFVLDLLGVHIDKFGPIDVCVCVGRLKKLCSPYSHSFLSEAVRLKAQRPQCSPVKLVWFPMHAIFHSSIPFTSSITHDASKSEFDSSEDVRG